MLIAPLHVTPASHLSARAALVLSAGGGVGALVAAGRPGDDVRFVLRRREPAASSSASTPSQWIVARAGGFEGSAGRRLAGWWSAEASERQVVVDEGCDIRVGPGRVDERVRRALLHWLPVSHRELAVLEAGVLRDESACAVGLLVRPPTVWSEAEARTEGLLHPRGPSFDAARFAALEEHARVLVRRPHLARAREAVARIESQLPFARLPSASRTVAAGCSALLGDDERCAAVAATLLARYAWSNVVSGT